MFRFSRKPGHGRHFPLQNPYSAVGAAHQTKTCFESNSILCGIPQIGMLKNVPSGFPARTWHGMRRWLLAWISIVDRKLKSFPCFELLPQYVLGSSCCTFERAV